MTDHQGRLHYEHAQTLIASHGDVPCYDAQVRCDHERAAVHAALAQAHALAAIAGYLEQLAHQAAILLMEPVPPEMGQVLTLVGEPEPEDAAALDDDTAWHPGDHRYAPDAEPEPEMLS